MTSASWLPEAVEKLSGLGRIARFQKDGAKVFGTDVESCIRSFRACVLALPFFYLVLIFDPGLQASGFSDNIATLLAQTIGYAVGCVLFPLAALPLLRWFGHEELWCKFVSAYNWLGLAQNLIVALSLVLGHFLFSEDATTEFAYLICVIFECLVFNVVLERGFLTAASLVLVDLVLNHLIDAITVSIS